MGQAGSSDRGADLATGRLVRPFDHALKAVSSFYLAYPRSVDILAIASLQVGHVLLWFWDRRTRRGALVSLKGGNQWLTTYYCRISPIRVSGL